MRLRLILVVVAIVAALGYFATAAPPGPRSLRVFDPDRVADLEIDMWKAYYAHERFRLFKDLLVSLHEQNRYSWSKAAAVGFRLARAAGRFADMKADYEQVLPDLERAYVIMKDWNGAHFDPAAVARAELKWWVARRIPGQNSPEQVGALIADENALLYEIARDRVLSASILRARAGRLRDDGGANAAWGEVSRLLHESYRQLHAAFEK